MREIKSSARTGARWVLRGQHLGVEQGGHMQWPDALSVFATFAERQQSGDLPEPAEGETSRIEFSDLQLALKLVLTAKDGLPELELVGEGGATSVSLPASVLDHDHVVVDGVWYSLDAASVEDAVKVTGPDLVSGPVRSLRVFRQLIQAGGQDGIIDIRLHPGQIDLSAFAPETKESPEGVAATLYPYQRDGWKWLRFCNQEQIGGLLGDEMGLGKTLQIISLLCDAGEASPATPALVIAPSTLLENWRREIAKFAPALRVLKHHGPRRTGRPAELAQYDAVITSYDTVMRDGGMFGMIEWPVIVLDEAQYIRNPDADRTRSVKALRKKVGFAVTGTPVENRLLDLWSLLDFAIPGYLGTRSEFESAFGNEVAGAERLEQLVTPVMLRRRVADVATDLPERIDIPQAIELSAEESSAYEMIRADIATNYGAAATLVSIGQLRQFCAHPCLVDHNLAAFSKLLRFDEIVAEIFERRQKVIIFTSYTAMADLLADRIRDSFGVYVRTLDGRLPIDQRVPLISEFSDVHGAAALVLNPKAGGAGLNITAANHVIHYNPEWNPALEDQASARAYRRGQDLPVTVHRLFCVGTVEEIVNERINEKRELAGAAVIGVAGKDGDYADLARALSISPVDSVK